EHLGGQFAAVFTGHGALDALDNGGSGAAVIFKLLGAVMHFDAGPLAQVFVIRTFIGILKATPAADIVHQHRRKVRAACLHIVDQTAQRFAPSDAEAAFALVGIGADDLKATALGVVADHVFLVGRGILLVFRAHAYILGRPNPGGRGCGLIWWHHGP